MHLPALKPYHEKRRLPMQTPATTQTTIPQHVVDQMENEWRQVRPERENTRPAQQPQQQR
jgi:hypothetical protein